jgi:hypothetical protein
MSIAPTLALYFLVQKELGKKALFPGKPITYKGKNIKTETSEKRGKVTRSLTFCTGNSDSSNAELLAQFSIFASTNPHAENEIFNFIDHNTVHETWEVQWREFGKFFGVEIENPSENSSFILADYMKDKQEVWNKYVEKHGGDRALWDYATWEFAGTPPPHPLFFFYILSSYLRHVDAVLGMAHPNGPFDLSKAQKIGWKKEVTPTQSYLRVFEKLRQLKMTA